MKTARMKAPEGPPDAAGPAFALKSSPGCDCARMMIVASPKTAVREGKMIRSNWWIMLWPMKATMTWATTTITNATRKSSTAVLLLSTDVRVTSATVPLTLLTMNQPKLAVSQLSAAGRRFPKNPNEARPSTIWGTPKRGPMDDRIACVLGPLRLPSVTPKTVGQNPPPKTAIGRTPTNTVANSILGDIQVQKS